MIRKSQKLVGFNSHWKWYILAMVCLEAVQYLDYPLFQKLLKVPFGSAANMAATKE